MDFDQKMQLIRAVDLRLAFVEAGRSGSSGGPGAEITGEADDDAGPSGAGGSASHGSPSRRRGTGRAGRRR